MISKKCKRIIIRAIIPRESPYFVPGVVTGPVWDRQEGQMPVTSKLAIGDRMHVSGAPAAAKSQFALAPDAGPGAGRFPFLSIERPHLHLLQRPRFDAVHSHRHPVRVGSRQVERLHSTVLTELMPCGVGVERVR
eukprot:EG_transcript_35966